MFKKIFYSVVRVLFNGLFSAFTVSTWRDGKIFPRKAQLSWRRIIKAILIRLSLAWRLKTASSIIWPKKSSLRIRFWVHSPPVRHISRKRGSIDRMAIRRAILELKEGNALGIFPEGTRIQREGLGRFHSGMASLAFMSGVSILPVAVVGSVTMPRKCGPLAVLIGKPIEVKSKELMMKQWML